jgi:sec-independent protein translocase protein TatB
MARHFRSGIDTMMREAELEEMEKKWREDNERIMREHPLTQGFSDPLALGAPPAKPGSELGPPPGSPSVEPGPASGPQPGGEETPRELP